MTVVLHVLDQTCDETTLQVVGTLLSHEDGPELRQFVCSIDGPTAEKAGAFVGREILRAERRVWPRLNWSPAMPELARRCNVDILHAWGPEAATLCSSRLPEHPLALTIIDSHILKRADRWVRTLPVDATVIAGDPHIHEELGRIGIVDERRVLVRPPVDRAAIGAAGGAALREEIAPDASRLVLLTGPATPEGGQSEGLWASAIVSKVLPGLSVVLPYHSQEMLRIWKFSRDIQMPSLLVEPKQTHTWAQLVACADVLMAPAVSEVNTYPLAVAMAGGLPIVGTQVPAIRELIADDTSGFLCEPGLPRLLASRLLTLLEDGAAARRISAAANIQAAELFDLDTQRGAYARVYHNIRAGRLPACGLFEPAAVS